MSCSRILHIVETSERRTQGFWDCTQALRNFHNISQLTRCEKNAAFALKNFDTLANGFYDRAQDSNYRSLLTREQAVQLRTEFASLADWILHNKELSILRKHPLEDTIRFQINLLRVCRYILFKLKSDQHYLHWLNNAVRLATETAIFCSNAKRWKEMEWCVSEAEFYRRHFSRYRKEYSVQLWGPYLLDGYLLFTLRLMLMHGMGHVEDDEMLVLHISMIDSVELSPEQIFAVTRTCFNIGLDHYNRKNYDKSFFWLKTSYRCAKLTNSHATRQTSRKALFLMALSLYQSDGLQNRDEILRILSLSGIGENLAAVELKFRTLLPGKTRSLLLVEISINLLSIYAKQERTKLRSRVLEVFDALEQNNHFDAIVKVLNKIPWYTGNISTVKETKLQHEDEFGLNIQWICAEIAMRTCIKNNFSSGCYLWLEEITHWSKCRDGNLDSLVNILTICETEALKFNSRHLGLKWFEMLVRITTQHGVFHPLITNAFRYALKSNDFEGLITAKRLVFHLSMDNVDIQLLRFKLLIDVIGHDLFNATTTCAQLDARYKKEKVLCYDYREGLHTLEVCAMKALGNTDMNKVLAFCVDAMMHEIKKRTLQTSLLLQVIRFYMKILSKLAVENDGIKTKCIENLISCLIIAYLGLKDSILSQNALQDSGGLELWFGHLAWCLANKCSSANAFHRHQLFKLCYKLLSLTLEKDRDIKQRISKAIVMSVAAGINSIHSYTHLPFEKILNSCFDLIDGFSGEQSCMEIIYYYKFYLLCELGDVKRLWDTFRSYQSHEKLKHVPHFFEGLAALASRDNQDFLQQILPSIECEQMSKDDYQMRNLNLQRHLTDIAIQCLKMSNRIREKDFQNNPQIDEIVLNWRRIIKLSSENIYREEDKMATHLSYCEKFRSFMEGNREQLNFSEISMFFNYIWNVGVETKIFHHSEASDEWIQLANGVASFSSDLQKIHRSLTKDLKRKLSSVWN